MSNEFRQITQKIMNTVFQTERVGGNEDVGIDSKIQEIINTGVSTAIKQSLNELKKHYFSNKARMIVGPFTYSYKFIPDVSREFIPNLSLLLTNVEQFSKYIDKYQQEPCAELIDLPLNDIKDLRLIDLVYHYCRQDEYDSIKAMWIEKENIDDRGVELDEDSIKMIIAIHILTIIHILLRSKDKTEIFKYEVPNEGIYTIEWKDEQWQFGFTLSE